MAVRVVNVKLVADATGLVQGFGKAKSAASDLTGKVKESAVTQRQEWATVGRGLTAVGVAITGIGVAALKTGIQYNTLQQTSRAALTSILGSAKAANEQMDKLDAFARTSPFAKQTFITAQQQMLAFGIEAKKVIPYLDAIQNAVAAAGGSNQDIAELAEIFGKIRSSAKITAIDLQQFGRRGINAAELIGSAMGKTGAEIRAEITAGTLDAGQALDALAQGMSTTYAGAADNVKNTFAGAMDRVKAAWRDFSSELAKPLVDPNGGGALVDLLNWVADMMRAFENLPQPIKEVTTALVGLGGVGALALGSAMLFLPKWLEFKDALKSLGVNVDGAASSLKGNLVPAMLALSLAVAAAKLVDWVDDLKGVTTASDQLAMSLRKTGTVAADLESGLVGGSALRGLGFDAQLAEQHLRIMNTTVGKLKATWDNSFLGKAQSVAVLGLGREAGKAAKQIEELDAALAGLVGSGHIDQAAKGYAEFAAMAEQAGWSQQEIADVLPLYTAAQAEAEQATEEAKNSLEGLAGVANDVTDAVSTLADEIINFGNAQINADRAAIQFQDRLAELNGIITEGAGELGMLSENGRKTEGAMLDVAEAAKRQAAAILESTGSQEDANAVLNQARDRLIESRIALGQDEAAARQWASERVPTAEAVRKKLDEVTASAKAIPKDSKANVSTDAPTAKSKIDDVTGAAKRVPSHTRATVTADTSGAKGPLQTVIGWLNNIRSGAHARVSGSGGGGQAGGGAGGGGVSGGRAHGGTIGYAHGGTIPGARNGLTLGMGGGVAQGTVFGAGTAKSDSILVRLSKGEEVVQEPFASQSRGLLKAINRGEFHQGMMQPSQTVVREVVRDVYVQNPFTGDYMLSQMKAVADGSVARGLGAAFGDSTSRRGVRL